MAQTNISIRIDEDIKKDAEMLFSKLGLTLSAATNIFYRQALRIQGIPFQISAIESQMKESILARGLEAMKEAQEQSLANGTSEMSLDDINAIISECRQERPGL
ncbi:MAG: type II toxin-antitoxin system RelB/DinJ family antitoxin [Oscillospiraceae bacterium]|nr:type II toxin-antitoxin system RelB/DinJ family antitoxin [Oscillospiraceae bacterium]